MTETISTTVVPKAQSISLALMVGVSVALCGALFELPARADKTHQAVAGEVLENTMCPVLTDQAVVPDMYVDYEGKRVNFCCLMCRTRFLEDPTAYLANLPQFVDRGSLEGGAGQEQAHDIPVEAGVSAPENGSPKRPYPAADPGQAKGGWCWVRFAGKFHPVVVHFPIALVIAAACAEVLSWWARGSLFRDAARYSLALGAVLAVITVLLGWAAGAFAAYPGLSWVLSVHRWTGTGAGTLIVITAILSEVAYRKQRALLRRAYQAFLFLSTLLVGITGHFGASLVYGLDHFVR